MNAGGALCSAFGNQPQKLPKGDRESEPPGAPKDRFLSMESRLQPASFTRIQTAKKLSKLREKRASLWLKPGLHTPKTAGEASQCLG
jgi:hypothetical protein